MSRGKIRKPLGYRIWFKIVLTLVIFIPAYASKPYNPARTSDVIASVLSHPWITSIPSLLPVAKLILLGAVVLPAIFKDLSGKILVAYYGIVLIPVSILQNMAVTEEYGYVWLIGNTMVQLFVAAYCLYDLAHSLTETKNTNICMGRLWVVIPMLIALLMPYTVDTQGAIKSSFSLWVLCNEAGVTYCMITPVVIGMLLLFSKGVYKPLLSVISYVGFLFGLMNMITWFVMISGNWWMGVLHLPLLILSIYGMLVVYEDKRMLIYD